MSKELACCFPPLPAPLRDPNSRPHPSEPGLPLPAQPGEQARGGGAQRSATPPRRRGNVFGPRRALFDVPVTRLPEGSRAAEHGDCRGAVGAGGDGTGALRGELGGPSSPRPHLAVGRWHCSWGFVAIHLGAVGSVTPGLSASVAGRARGCTPSPPRNAGRDRRELELRGSVWRSRSLLWVLSRRREGTRGRGHGREAGSQNPGLGLMVKRGGESGSSHMWGGQVLGSVEQVVGGRIVISWS